MENLYEFMEKHPHNTDCGDRFMDLLGIAYRLDNSGESVEEFVQYCLDYYGGTIAGALIDFIKNKLA